MRGSTHLGSKHCYHVGAEGEVDVVEVEVHGGRTGGLGRANLASQWNQCDASVDFSALFQ
jgi:hypothetical protein